jgi:hypothetical protein
VVGVEEALENQLPDVGILNVIDDPSPLFSGGYQSGLTEFGKMLRSRSFGTSSHSGKTCYVVIPISQCPQHRQPGDVRQQSEQINRGGQLRWIGTQSGA